MRVRAYRQASAMDELTSLSCLIGDIYDAALDPSLWPSVLKQISGFIQASAATLECRMS